MTDNPGNTNRLEDEDLDQVAGGILNIQSDDYLAEIIPDRDYTREYVSASSIIEQLEDGVCPTCNQISIHRLPLNIEYSCDNCNKIYCVTRSV